VNDTIFALSSGAPPAAIAVLRISGPRAFAVAESLAGRLPEPRRAALRALHDPASGCLLDRALIMTFPKGGSATGEPLVELHVHGGRAVIAAVENALAVQCDLRMAEPGEFTRRALLAGKIDLSEAEGLGDLLTAETETQRRAAIESAEGAVSRAAASWRAELLALSALVEAELDFSDEDDVAASALEDIRTRAGSLAAAIGGALSNPPVERLRDGIRVTLAGPPNSGKSTLLNALIEREAAIVSPIPGTTRDRIEAPVSRNGVAYLFTDTAGVRAASDDPIERIGIARSEAAIQEADILLWLGDDQPPRADALWIHARADLPGRNERTAGAELELSAVTGQGMEALWAALSDRARDMLPRLDRLVLNRRQRECAMDCRDALERGAQVDDALLVAEEFRQARNAIDRLVGRADVDAMLDQLFARFCIGK